MTHFCPPAYAPPDLSDEDFTGLARLIEGESGIHLVAAKRMLVLGRLAPRLRALGIDSFEVYHRRVLRDPEERSRMLDCITTNETGFFREPWQFAFLTERAVPTWKAAHERRERVQRLRVWSAGCSTGEEPFSVAMTLSDHLVSDGWSVEIVATDISRRALARAEAATWSDARTKQIPTEYLRRFMLRGTGTQQGKIRASDELRRRVRFSWLNLNAPDWPTVGLFDLILCRNVLIYFDRATKSKLVARLLDLLAPGGYLLGGHAESLQGLSSSVRTIAPTIHTRAPGAGHGEP